MSSEIMNFIKARFVRLRLQGFRALNDPLPKWIVQDLNKSKKLFYSFKDISIVGQCICNGHAANCRHSVGAGVSYIKNIKKFKIK